jgi:hypothetical protein
VPGLAGVGFKAGTATQFDRPFGSPSGRRWALTALANLATTEDEVVIIGVGPDRGDVRLVAREGTNTPFDVTRQWGPFDQRVSINEDGRLAFKNNLAGAVTTDDELIAVYAAEVFQTIIAREGQPAPSLGNFGTTLTSSNVLSDGTVAFGGTIAGLPTAQNFAVFSGATLVAQKGVTIPGGPLTSGTPWEFFDSDDLRFSADGTVNMFKGDDAAPTTEDKIVTVNNTVVIRENRILTGTTPVAPSAIDEIYLSPLGDWMARGNNTNSEEDWVVRNGTAVASNNAPIFTGSAENYSDNLFTDAFFFITGNGCLGDYVVGGTTDNPDPLLDAVLVLNGTTVVARQGDMIDLNGNGLPDDSLYINTFNNDDGFLSDDGYLYFFADVKTDPLSATSTNQAFLVVRVFCPGDINRDGVTDFSDLLDYLNLYNGQARCADLNGDGVVDFSDLLEYLNLYNSGCAI